MLYSLYTRARDVSHSLFWSSAQEVVEAACDPSSESQTVPRTPSSAHPTLPTVPAHSSVADPVDLVNNDQTLIVVRYAVHPYRDRTTRLVRWFTVLVHQHSDYSVAQVAFGLRPDDPQEHPMNMPTTHPHSSFIPRPIHLSWEWLTEVPFQFVVDSSDVYYQLYGDAIFYLRSTFEPAALTRVAASSHAHSMSETHPSIGTLVNALADRYTLQTWFPEKLTVNLCSDSTLDFLLFGVLFHVHQEHHWRNEPRPCPCGGIHPRAFLAIRSDSIENTSPTDEYYQAGLLDIIAALWRHECSARQQSEWSPMPWSRASVQERRNEGNAGTVMSVHCPDINEQVASLRVSDGDFRILVLERGHPLDIPWLNAPHDGYQLCFTPAQYVFIRRAGMVPTMRDDAALWLAAMTFGLLEAITGVKVPEALLLSQSEPNGATIISGMRILRFIQFWHKKMKRFNWEDDIARRGRCVTVVQLINTALLALNEQQGDFLSVFSNRAGYSHDRLLEFLGSTTVTVFTLCAYAADIWQDEPTFRRILTHRDPVYYAYAEIACQKHMVRSGWCPYIIPPILLRSLGRSHLSMFAHLPPLIRNASDEHQRCTMESCCIYTITDTNSYVARHVRPSCTCDYIKAPIKDVETLLSDGERGTIPVILFSDGQITVKAATDVPYVAISHVWADGLGSTTEEGLPGCQVARIAGLVESLSPGSAGPATFWMDSLCVPERQDLRKRAIKLMAKTYKDATSVLVIDACIRSQCSRTMPVEENVLRIATSGWVRRVWTLQEGLLAKDLYFEFADGPINAERIFSSKLDPTNAIQSSRATNDWSQWRRYAPLLSFRAENWDLAAGQPVKPRDVLKLLQTRTTSKAEDETVAISSLFPDADVGALFSITGPDAVDMRMRAFLLQLKKVPRKLPVMPHLTFRLDVPNFRWAPRTLAEVGGTICSCTATCTEEGLFAEYDIVRLDTFMEIGAAELDGSEETVNAYIVDFATESAFRLYVNLPPLRNVKRRSVDGSGVPHGRHFSFDALLYLHGDRLDDRPAQCAAVRRRVAEQELGYHGAVGGSGTGRESIPTESLHCEYVTTAEFQRILFNREELRGDKHPHDKGIILRARFDKGHVRLT